MKAATSSRDSGFLCPSFSHVITKAVRLCYGIILLRYSHFKEIPEEVQVFFMIYSYFFTKETKSI